MSHQTTRRRFLKQVVAGAGALGVPGRRCASADDKPNPLTGLDSYTLQAMANWNVPGLAVAVVHNGQLVHARGYGVRRLGSDDKVDAETLFSSASCTKAFTAAAIAKLIDGGAVGWDDPIVRHLPEFQLSDPAFTSSVTIRHALSHRAGLPTANMLWRSGALDSNQILGRLRWLQPVAEPGQRFLYNNNMYLVLGKLVEQLSGRKWTDFVRSELFQPLGMTSTVADSSGIKGRVNVASPHAADTGTAQLIDCYCPDVIAPAGTIHSNVLDLAKWVTMHLENGRYDNRQVLSKARIDELHTAPGHAPETPGDPKIPRAPIRNYGLGWFFNEHAGRRVIEHSGVQTGFVAWIAMIPEERLGLVVLSNNHQTGLNSALRSWILDAMLGKTPRDWSEEVRKDYTNGYQRQFREAKAQFDSTRPAKSPLPRPLGDYAGRYTSKLYGDIVVTSKDNNLQLQLGTRFDGRLEHWQNDEFRAFFPNPRLDDWLVTFKVEDGAVKSLHAKESPWAPAWYDDADDLGEFRRH